MVVLGADGVEDLVFVNVAGVLVVVPGIKSVVASYIIRYDYSRYSQKYFSLFSKGYWLVELKEELVTHCGYCKGF